MRFVSRGIVVGVAAVGTLGVAVVGALAAAPNAAHACGGFFCSNSAPTVQTSERIVFGVEPDGTVETHVQIVYTGTAPRFAWILPVPSLPELALGTDALFSALDDATSPRFPLERRTDGRCRPVPSCRFHPSCATPPPTPPPPPPPADAGPRDLGMVDGTGVMVFTRENVGAFDAVVLTAVDAATLVNWLRVNGYDIPAVSTPLLQAYVDAGDFFVALRLQPGRDTGEIQPLVLRYDEPEPCIPIRLTSIATVPDMPITAYVLGASYATPLNYAFIDPPETLGLWMGGASYTEEITRLANEAGGRAFATDYAEATPSIEIHTEPIDDLRTATTPAELVRGVIEHGYASDPQLLAVLAREIAASPGSDPDAFFACLARSTCRDYDAYVPPGWSPSDVVDAIVEAIITPRSNALALLRRHARLTRLFTTMSADEMTVDPVFRIDEGMPAISNVRTATIVTECSSEYVEGDAPQRIDLPSGRSEGIREGTPRDDETYCHSLGGTTGEPSPGDCMRRDAGGATEMDGSVNPSMDGSVARMDGGSGARTRTEGGCAAAAGRPMPDASSFVVAVLGLIAIVGTRRRRR